MTSRYDAVVIGAGIFGSYAALAFSRHGARVLLVDSQRHPWTKASVVNQARLHQGYHYPRSIATARQAQHYRARFMEDHADCITGTFRQFYGIDRHGSLTNANQFARFCDFLGVSYRESMLPETFCRDRLETVFEVSEPTFDPFLLALSYQRALRDSTVETRFGWHVADAGNVGSEWRVTLQDDAGGQNVVGARMVLNATYANINSVNRHFGFDPVDATHEVSEIVLVQSRRLKNIGLTVMDGPYPSIMPYGRTAFHSLTSVPYTHHWLSHDSEPTFPCQAKRSDCRPESLAPCTRCPVKPSSNATKMSRQLRLYLQDSVDLYIHGSLWTVKTKLASSYIDDARPTDVRVLSEDPVFALIFSGKVTSIYEVEKLTDAI